MFPLYSGGVEWLIPPTIIGGACDNSNSEITCWEYTMSDYNLVKKLTGRISARGGTRAKPHCCEYVIVERLVFYPQCSN